jgi:ribonuclease P protein component
MVCSRGPAGSVRVGLVVSRNCGSAVRRNRIKRRLRAAVQDVGLDNGNDYVIIATPQVAEIPFDQLRHWLKDAVEELAGA